MRVFATRLGIVLAAVLFASAGLADVAFLSAERQQWFSQIGPNPVPYYYRFTALAGGAGFQDQGVSMQGPGATNLLTGSAVQVAYSTNIGVLSLEGTNGVSGADRFNLLYPAGPYNLVERMIVLGRYRTNIYPVPLTNAFPPAPAITNVGFPAVLQATQTFQWPVFSSNASSYAVFYLFEGDLDTNILVEFRAGGVSSLTNLALLAREARLPAAQTQVTVSNLNPYADHLVLLEFHDLAATNAGSLPLKETGAVSASAILYLAPEIRIVSQPQSQSVPANSAVTFSVGAVGTPPLSYQWRFNGTPLSQATNLLLVWFNVQSNRAGAYDVVVSNPLACVTSSVAVLTVTSPTNTGSSSRTIHLESPAVGAGGCQFWVNGSEGDVYQILRSADLKTWDPLAVLTNRVNPAPYTDRGALTNTSRFYRVEWLGNLEE